MLSPQYCVTGPGWVNERWVIFKKSSKTPLIIIIWLIIQVWVKKRPSRLQPYFYINHVLDYMLYHGCTDSTSHFNSVNTLRPRQNGRHFADDIFKCIFLNENVWIPIKISMKFVPKGPINNIPALVQIMAWRRPGDKPLSEPMMASLTTHICVTRPQWVKKTYDHYKQERLAWQTVTDLPKNKQGLVIHFSLPDEDENGLKRKLVSKLNVVI